MKFRMQHINLRYFLPFLLIIAIFLNTDLCSQPKYHFDFDEDWDWYDLMLTDWCQNSTILTSYVKAIKEEFTIEEGRMLFRELIKLDSLNQLVEIVQIPHLEEDTNMVNWRLSLDNTLINFNQFNTFDGLLTAAYVLSKYHVRDYFNGSYFKKRKYFENAIPPHKLNIKINFEYFPAEYLLDLLDKDKIEEDDFTIIDTSEVIESFYRSAINPDMTRDKFIKYVSLAQNKSPVFKIFKIINPVSFKTLGGVSLYTQNFREVLKTIEIQQESIKKSSLYLLSLFLSDSLTYNTSTLFSFGNFTDTISNEENIFLLKLEDCGDDYEKVSKLIARGVFKVIKDDIELNINKYLIPRSDSVLLTLMDDIYYSSCINYIASEFKEDRPSALLEKDFLVFNKTIEGIFNNYSQSYLDSMFRIGFTGQALYYTLGMQVANYIDRFSGKVKLKNSIVYGPIYFFNSYIDMYEQNPSQIRNVFTFSNDFENKVREWASLVNYKMQGEVLNIQKYHNDSSLFFTHIGVLSNVYRNDLYIFNLLVGQMLEKYEYFTESLKFFRMALPYVQNKNALNRKIAEIEEKINILNR